MSNIAIENGPVEIVDFHIKKIVIFHGYVKLPEGKHEIWDVQMKKIHKEWDKDSRVKQANSVYLAISLSFILSIYLIVYLSHAKILERFYFRCFITYKHICHGKSNCS